MITATLANCLGQNCGASDANTSSADVTPGFLIRQERSCLLCVTSIALISFSACITRLSLDDIARAFFGTSSRAATKCF